MGDNNDCSIASLSVIADESLCDASKSEAAEAKSQKCTKTVVQTTRKGKTPAEKRTNKQARVKLSNTQTPTKDGRDGKCDEANNRGPYI